MLWYPKKISRVNLWLYNSNPQLKQSINVITGVFADMLPCFIWDRLALVLTFYRFESSNSWARKPIF